MIYGRLRLLGDFQLTPGPDPHTRPVFVPSPYGRILLAYLALHPNQPVDRNMLAFLIWEESDEETARRALRQRLHQLRRILTRLGLPDEILRSAGGQLRFRPDLGLWVDALAFREQAGDPRWQIEAIELYRGDLLPDCAAAWLSPLRADLREKYMDALRRQIDGAKMQRNYSRALYYARRLLAANPLRESSHRIQMELYYLAGKRAQAIRQYRRLETLLRQELKAEPMPQTVELYRRIRDGALAADIPLAVRATGQLGQALDTSAAVNRSFFARREELAQLDEALSQTMRGRGRLVLVEGESGLGKTRLLQTWREMRQTQMLLYAADCEEGVSPFASLVDASDAPLAPPPAPAGLGTAILSLAERAGQAVCLLLDDLHRMGAADWDLLAFLGRRCGRVPLLVAGAYEPRQISAHAGRVMRSLRRGGALTTLRLWPFSPAHTAQLARALLPETPLDDAFLLRLYYVTEGNPFFITELLRLMRAAGASPQDFLQGEVAWPRTVRDMVDGRIRQVSPPTRAILAAAAHLGRRFGFTAVAQSLPHLHEYDILDALDEALRAGLLREAGEGYTFSHEQIRLRLYQRGGQD